MGIWNSQASRTPPIPTSETGKNKTKHVSKNTGGCTQEDRALALENNPSLSPAPDLKGLGKQLEGTEPAYSRF